MICTVCPNCGLPSQDGSEILRCPKCHYTKEFMEYAEFARLIGTSVYTIQRWVKTGHVNTRNFGARIHRIHCSEYDRLAGLPPKNSPT
ncbi:MAG: hypothetical protein LBH43_20820 [Treponema sp.]|jgi:hypothetical protein|nr:hypothetical protein [Treponema sp.]